MASSVPIAGSAYTYAYATLGEFIAWIIGWDLILEYAFGATAVADRLVRLCRELPAGRRPADLAAACRLAAGLRCRDRRLVHTGALVNLPAMLIIAAMTALLIVGIQRIGPLQQRDRRHQGGDRRDVHRRRRILFRYRATGSRRAIPKAISFRRTRHRAYSAGAACCAARRVVFFAYIGFDAVSTAAQEATNPRRDMPIGILGSLVICTRALRDRSRRADRHRALRQARRPRSDRRRHRRHRPDVARATGETRGRTRPDLGNPRPAAWPGAHLLRWRATVSCPPGRHG